MLIIGVGLFLFFTFRDQYLLKAYLKDGRFDWDGADIFTMNVFAGMFFTCFVAMRILLHYIRFESMKFVIDVLLGVSAGDIIHRIRGIYFFKKDEDYELLFITVLLALVWLVISNYSKIKLWISIKSR